ncbi:hypothetical protein MELA_00457 [Candidatus Methylomirabilis lanthanidiphila]|uniref:Uncharacterized protein n=1 Tax=Candidatus Methylomirabilis lanthanidiphila TaxID=2211376 RepID=A0A564ZHF1_9BACT|nr:hypothetical protein MELA_00457 [Candidatus Methylomirabilis lanthanidiphila]
MIISLELTQRWRRHIKALSQVAEKTLIGAAGESVPTNI